jgi:tetratricopeptide (TPR) repeat protein
MAALHETEHAQELPLRRSPTDDGRVALGERIRELRVARGLTQAELAGDRFSKQYLSGIERGLTRPSRETLAWLAGRLQVDPRFLEIGLARDEWTRLESAIAQAEAANEAQESEAALSRLEAATQSAGSMPLELELRFQLARGWALLYTGKLRAALGAFERARDIASRPQFGRSDRADALFRLGCARYKLSSTTKAMELFTSALAELEEVGPACDRLRSLILSWRARCYRRQRDWEAARDDVELALELAERLGDPRSVAEAEFQASIIAEREGRWVLARLYAERARLHYETSGDRQNTGRLLNNLGGLTFLLGDADGARSYLSAAFATALEVGSRPDAAQAVSSLAQVNLRTGNAPLAARQAREALRLLDGREDFVDEIGNAELVLGRALLEQGDLVQAEYHFAAADDAFSKLSSGSHRAAAWTAQADLAVRRGDKDLAIGLYQRAVTELQDFRF